MYSKLEKKIEVIFEFLIFGIIVGIIEDVIAVKIVSGEPITYKVIGIIFIIAVPFAIIGEIVADNIDFIAIFKRIIGFFKKQFSR